MLFSVNVLYYLFFSFPSAWSRERGIECLADLGVNEREGVIRLDFPVDYFYLYYCAISVNVL